MAEQPTILPGLGGVDVPSSHLVVCLLGHGTVERDGQRVDALMTQRMLRLLARLAVATGGCVDRHTLAFDLWPDSTERQALANLRRALYDLRTADRAGEFLVVDSDVVGWSPGVRVDVLQLRRAIDRGAGGEVARLYVGDLLPSCYDDWLLAGRDRLREAALAVIEATAMGTTQPATRLALARAVLAIDPLREVGYRLAMRAYADLGQRAEALRAYHRCVEVLERELAVGPDGTTLALHDELLAAAGRVAVAAPQPSGSRTATLVGRDADVAAIDNAWQRALTDAAQLVLVTGEAGIGKSRLVGDAAGRLARDGVPVARARAYEAAGGLPWGPVTDWLRTDELAGPVQRMDPPWRTELARLLPELREGDRVPTPVVPGDPRGRRALFDALLRALTRTGGPLLLVLDDLQWCDEDTADFIGFLITGGSSASLMIAATARSEELTDNERAGSVIARLRRDGCLTEIELDRLDAESTAQIAGELCARPIGAADRHRLWLETEGNPLFTVELARAGWSGQQATAKLPPTLRSAIASRLDRLTEPARHIAEVASTIGRAFGTAVVAEAAGIDENELIDGLDELWRRQLIREHGHGYDFTHDKLREVLHSSIAPARARRLHHQVAAALAAIHADELAPVSRLIAAQLSAAGQPAAAIDGYRRAAGHALGLFALDETIDCLERALRCIVELPPTSERDRTEMELNQALTAPVAWSDGYGADRTVGVYERVVALCRRTAQAVDPAALRGLGLAYLSRCDFGRAMPYAAELLSTAGSDPVTIVEGNYLMGVCQFWRGDLASAHEHLGSAVRLYSRERSEEHIARFVQDPKAICLVRLALTRLMQGEPDDARGLLAEAGRHSEDVGDPGTRVYVLCWIQITAIELGDLDLAQRCSSDLEALLEPFEGSTLLWFETLHRFLRAFGQVTGGDARGLDPLSEIAHGWGSATEPLFFGYGLLAIARSHARFGDASDVEAGRHAVDEALRWAGDHDQHYLDAPLWLAGGELCRRQGDAAGASAAAGRALAIARRQGARWYEHQALAALDDTS